MNTRWTAICPRLIYQRPANNSAALVPFSVALIAGNIAYCSGIAIKQAAVTLSYSDVHRVWLNAERSSHAAGFLVLRFAMMNASPNMNAENRISVAIELPSGNASLPGYSRLRNASVP